MFDNDETDLGDGVRASLNDGMIKLRFARAEGTDDVVYIGAEAFAALQVFARKAGLATDMDSMRAALAKGLEGAVTDESVQKATKKMRDLADDFLTDLQGQVQYGLADHLSHHVKEMAGRTVKALLEGNESEMVRWLHCDQRGYNGRSDGYHANRSIEEQHPIIHGKLFEQGCVALRKKIAEAHRDLITDQRILDLEDQVRSLVAQNNKLERERNELRERVRYEAA